ncbi:MAG: class I adenylate-forming enzyme family protein [Conexibacter sp.]
MGAQTETLLAPLRRALRVAPDACAVVCGEERMTHAALAARTRRLGAALRGLGLAPGDRVAVVGPNCHRYLELYLGVPAAGLVLVPLNTRHTDPELRYALEDSGARVLIADREIDGAGELVEHAIPFDDAYDRFVEQAADEPWAEGLDGDTLAGLFYTGGTTGAAKGVMLTHGNLVANAYHFMACWPFTADTRWLVIAPMFHAAGTIGTLATTWAGGAHVVMGAFDPGRFLDLVERERVSATLVVPTMMAAIAEEQLARPRDVGSLRYLSHGSSPVATEILRRTREAFPNAELLHVYGATETSPIVTLLPNEERVLDGPRARSCGQPAIGVELAIRTPAGEPVADGEIGEVHVRGRNVTSGYWRKPEQTAAALRDGWYATGDLGYLDEAGYLYLVDRAKDMIVTGGENVYSVEVEEALYRHPAVREAAVFGIPDERWGEAVHAVVVTAQPVTAAELVDHAKTLVAGYKVPKAIELRTEPLPKSGAGKILKRELRETYWQGRDRRV